jgi:hypothetical protein
MFGWMPARDVPELCEAGDAAFAAYEEVLEACEKEGVLDLLHDSLWSGIGRR